MKGSRDGRRSPSAAPRIGKQKGGSGGLRAARAHDLGDIEALLASCGLPVEGVRAGRGEFFVYADDCGTLLGAVGVEFHGSAGLLRSTAVMASARSRGIAATLIGHALSCAQEHGCRDLYLLTLDAGPYFKRFGFAEISRDEAPVDIQASPEFTTLCPASAVLMRKMLKA